MYIRLDHEEVVNAIKQYLENMYDKPISVENISIKGLRTPSGKEPEYNAEINIQIVSDTEKVNTITTVPEVPTEHHVSTAPVLEESCSKDEQIKTDHLNTSQRNDLFLESSENTPLNNNILDI